MNPSLPWSPLCRGPEDPEDPEDPRYQTSDYHWAMQTRIPTAVLFDWDGTIMDSAEATFRTYQRLFGEYGHEFDHRRFEQTYSPDWYQTYIALGIDESLWHEVDSRWMAIHAEEEYDLIPGAREALERLRVVGAKLGVVTSGSRERVMKQIAEMGLAELFDVAVFSEDVVKKKPDPEGLHLGLARLGVTTDAAYYVGDSPEDVRMARAAGVTSVGIPGGFPNRDALVEAKADLFAESLAEAVVRMLE